MNKINSQTLYTSMDSDFSTSKARTKFRQSEVWQQFRRQIVARENFTCQFCGKKYKNIKDLNIHHRYETSYDNLEPSRFYLLCKACHEFIHLKYNSPAFADLRLYGLKD